MVGQRAVAARVAGSRPRGTPEGPAERAARPAPGRVGPPPVARVPVVPVPVVPVKARALAAVMSRESPRDLRRGLPRPPGRAGRAARLPPEDLAGPATPAARHRVTSHAAVRPVTGLGPRGRTGPGRRARGTANVTAASALTTGALPVTGSPPVTVVRGRMLPPIGRPAGVVRMTRRPGLPVVGPGMARRGATLAVTAPRRRPADVTAAAGRNARPPGGSGPGRGTGAAPGAR
jgi:hypothetical protein